MNTKQRKGMAQMRLQASDILVAILTAYSDIERLTTPERKVLFDTLAEAYASANFGTKYGDGEMLTLDEADIVKAYLDRVAESLGKKYVQLADHYTLEERYTPVRKDETPSERVESLWNKHHNSSNTSPRRAVLIAKTLAEDHGGIKWKKRWWEEVANGLEEKIKKYGV